MILSINTLHNVFVSDIELKYCLAKEIKYYLCKDFEPTEFHVIMSDSNLLVGGRVDMNIFPVQSYGSVPHIYQLIHRSVEINVIS